MSRYCMVETQFTQSIPLIKALAETGMWCINDIEIHNEPQSLYGFHGDERPQKANIIIRRNLIGKMSNDIGFILGSDNTYQAIISEFDSKEYGEQWIATLKSNYVFHVINNQMESRGRTVSRKIHANGKQRITITGYR